MKGTASRAFTIMTRMAIFLGIDIGGTSVKAAMVRDGAMIATARSDGYARPDQAALEHAVGGAVRDVIVAMSEAELQLDAVGLCAPGLFDEASRTITLSVNVPGLVGLNLDELAARAIGKGSRTSGGGTRPVTIVTDAHAATFDAWASGGAPSGTGPRPSGRFLGIALGTGVGACVLDDGVPLLVSGRSPGHVGQIDVSIAERGDGVPIGPDGGRGSLEAYMGVPALIRRFGQDFGPGLIGSDVNDSPLAALVRAIRICHAMYRPNTIALLGGVGMALRPRLSDLFAAVGRDLTSVARAGWTLAGPGHAFHAACGAARLAGATSGQSLAGA